MRDIQVLKHLYSSFLHSPLIRSRVRWTSRRSSLFSCRTRDVLCSPVRTAHESAQGTRCGPDPAVALRCVGRRDVRVGEIVPRKVFTKSSCIPFHIGLAAACGSARGGAARRCVRGDEKVPGGGTPQTVIPPHLRSPAGQATLSPPATERRSEKRAPARTAERSHEVTGSRDVAPT